MIKCNKCYIEKEDNQFQTYWHSTQNKHRMRKTCTVCYYNQRNERKRLKRQEKSKLIQEPIPTEIIQPVPPELEIEVSIDKDDILIDRTIEKRCNTCKQVKPLEQYYKSGKLTVDGRYNRCIECELNKSKEDREEELKENGGSGRHYENPNKYYDEYQKEATFNILLAIGWNFNEDKGIWWKEGIKTEDGQFLNITPKKRRSSKTLTKDEYVEIFNLRKQNWKLWEIATKYNITKGGVHQILKRFNDYEDD